LATRPLSAAAAPNPFMDFLFSARPAFIWDGAKGTVSWMNAAARESFALGPSEFAKALPAEAAASLATFAKAAARKSAPGQGVVSLKFPRKRNVFYCLQRLELAGGSQGVIAVESGTKAPQLQEPPAARPAKRKPRKKASLPSNAVAPSSLTPGELRSFKAIGRTVLKLCDAKQAAEAAKNAPGQTLTASSGGEDLRAPFTALLAAFDLVLILDEAFAIAQCEGRPQRLGWRKPALLGAPVAALFPASEQAVFRRLTNSLPLDPDGVCRETLLVGDESGGAYPCVAFFGPLADGRSGHFLALLSLKLPQRLKKLSPLIVRAPAPARLAA